MTLHLPEWKWSTQNEQLLFVALCVVTGLLLISFIRIILLLRQQRKMDERAGRLEKQILDQQKELMAVRADSAAWRGEMQRQFDGFRSDSTRRCGESELRAQDLQRRMDETVVQQERKMFEMQAALDAARRMCAELPAAKARIIELERQLGSMEVEINGEQALSEDEMQSVMDVTRSVAALPVLPSMEALRSEDETLGMEIDAMRSNLAETQQRNAELQRALLLARRKRMPMMRKPRGR